MTYDQNVLLSSTMPHNVCVCKNHANFNYIVEALTKVLPNFPPKASYLISELVRDIESEQCMTDVCNNCSNKTI